MIRKKFITQSGKAVVGSLIFPQLIFTTSKVNPKLPTYGGILRSIYPIAKEFLKRIVEKGVEKYATDQVVGWLENTIGSQKVKKKEIEKLPKPMLNNQVVVNGGQNQIFVGLDELKRPEIIMIPALATVDTAPANLLSNHSYVPIIKNDEYKGTPNFPELVGLNELAKYYSSINNFGSYKKRLLSDALLPSTLANKKARTFYALEVPDGMIASSVFKTKMGQIHIIYEVSEKLKVKGQITYVPEDSFDDIDHRIIDFSHDFS